MNSGMETWGLLTVLSLAIFKVHPRRFKAPNTLCLEKRVISTISEFDEIRRGS